MCLKENLTNVILAQAGTHTSCMSLGHGFGAPSAQRGFLLPAAIFILVALAGLAVAVARLTSQSSLAAVQEVVSVQTFYAAESGAQYAMSRIFYVPSGGAAISRAAANASCVAVNGANLAFSGAGLATCSTSLNCSISTDAANTTSFFRIVSAATCGSAEVTAQRSIEVSASIQ